ncbi:MAG TPA: hypothetical protein VK752_22880 [Bryobacteraceae bacterium]|jgi:hypothetical protein|nr:hypothetical protein [Bryobacteraceae bacterium]
MHLSKGRARFGAEFLLGAALYVASFFLPAVVPTKQGAPLPGYSCAWIALLILTFLPAGLVNPILVTYATLAG